MKMVSCKVMTIKNQQGYQGIRGLVGVLGPSGGVRDALGAGRECRCSVANGV